MSETPQPTISTQAARVRTDWGALGLGLLLLLSSIGLLTSAPLLALLGLFAPASVKPNDSLSLLMLSTGSFALGLLLLPGTYLNARKFFNLPEPTFRFPSIHRATAATLLGLLWIITLALGAIIHAQPLPAKLLLPFLNVPAVFLPIGILLIISLRNLPMPSQRRGWSIFGASAILGPMLTILFEMIALAGIILLFAIYASSTPGLDVVLQNLATELQSDTASLDFLAQEAATLLLAPGGLTLLLGLFSLLVPIIEEALKVFLLWLYAGRLRSPVEGFVLGVLCGAAFALAENISFASSGAENWLVNVLSRASAGLPHIFNSGLMGWALASAWQERRYARLGWTYLAAILVHGAWNALSIALALNNLSDFAADLPAIIATPFPAAITWGLLAIGLFLGLSLANTQMRKQAAKGAVLDVGYNPPLSS